VAAALKKELGVEADLEKGHSGIFEVAVNGKVVATKGRSGFPTPEQVVDAVARALGIPAAGRG
jgi:predicted Rdx family selenoprotein